MELDLELRFSQVCISIVTSSFSNKGCPRKCATAIATCLYSLQRRLRLGGCAGHEGGSFTSRLQRLYPEACRHPCPDQLVGELEERKSTCLPNQDMINTIATFLEGFGYRFSAHALLPKANLSFVYGLVLSPFQHGAQDPLVG